MSSPEDQSASAPRFFSRFPALRHRNYRLFLFGQTVSNTGSWVQTTALQWLVYAVITDSAWLLGTFNFLAQIPILVLGLLAGAVADSFNRHRIIIRTQFLMTLYASTLALLTLIHHSDGRPLVAVWYGAIFVLAAVNGAVQAFDLPARQAFLFQLVPKPDLPNAVALNSLMFNATRIVGPSLAGGIVYLVHRIWPGRVGLGEGVCFTVNAISFIAVLVSLFRMGRFPNPERPPTGERLSYLVEGIRYVRRMPHLLALHIFLGIIAVFALPYLMLSVVYVKKVLHGNAAAYGAINACIGIGAIAGGALLVHRNQLRGLGRVIAMATGCFSVIILLLAWNPGSLWVAGPLFGMAGFCMVIAMISSQTLIQTLVAEGVRGRVMSLYTMLNVGLMPIGSLISGALAERLGVGWTLTLNASVCLATTAYFALRLPALRRAAHATPEWQQAVSAIRSRQRGRLAAVDEVDGVD